MRSLGLLIVFLTIGAAEAQTTNAPATNSTPAVRSGQRLFSPRQTPAFTLRASKPNELVKGRLTYSGVAVEAFKTRRPLQLLDPLAPATYGTPEDNIVRDSPKGKILGLKLFAVSF